MNRCETWNICPLGDITKYLKCRKPWCPKKTMPMFSGHSYAREKCDNDKEAVLKGIQLLKAAGVNVRQNVQFYVYVHDDSQYESGVERCRILKEQGTNPFVMFNIDNKRSPRIKHLQRWANRKWLFWSMDIEQYRTVA